MGAAAVTHNRTLLEKADLALADLTANGGLLAPAQSQKFMRIMINEAVVMKMATVVPMRAHKQVIEKIRFGSMILRRGTEARALAEADRSKPDTSAVELDAKLFKGEVRLNNEVLEDTIEKGQLRQTVMQLMAERIAFDMDLVIVQSDVSSPDPVFSAFNGLLAGVTSNTYDALTQPSSKVIWDRMVKTMPTEFMRNRSALRILTSIDSELDYRNTLAERATAVGDKFLEGNAPVVYAGIPIVGVPAFPENLGVGSNSTNALLIDPKNINVGIWREIRIETDKLVSEGVLIIVATLRMDVKFAHEPAVVRATNIKVA